MSAEVHRSGSNPPGTDHVFVLRFWIEREAGPDGAAVWRAKVSDLSTGTERHANDVDGALAHVREAMVGRST